MRERELARELSALLDGELSPERARELRQKIEAEPELRDRLAAFESIDQLLQSIPQPEQNQELHQELHQELQSDLRARLQERIDRLESVFTVGSFDSPRAKRSIARWGAPLAAALAVGLMAIWLTRPTGDSAIQDASDEELAIAFEFETLRELDMILELDLLEALLAMDDLDTTGKPTAADPMKVVPMEEGRG